MNRRLLLQLFSLPTLVGSSFCWLAAMPGMAAAGLADDAQVCIMSSHGPHNMICTKAKTVRVANPNALIDLGKSPQESPDRLEFTDKESDAAIALFGCDCPACINALRGLQLQAS
jgi:hypothetical protein